VALIAVVSGLTGGSMVLPFVAGAAILVGWAVAAERLDPRALVRSAPTGAFAVVVIAALAAGPIAGLAGILPRPLEASPLTLVAVALAGGGLSALVNNLPAAAFGAAWIGVAPPEVVVAFLVGTNFGSIATPHGSVATILARSAARLRGPDTGLRTYLASAWRYAAATGLAAVAALVLFR
jgi:Na+/H+ antiporter NhaD/arsenite permease-like protein